MPIQIQQYLLPHRIQEMLSCCPQSVATYATFHLDSISKIINHLLILLLALNVLLFLTSWNVSLLPNVGFSTVSAAFFLCFQTVCVWAMLNNHRISALPSSMDSSEFIIGVALGISIGGAVLSFVVSSTFGNISKCNHSESDPVYEYVCGGRRGSLAAVWFWSGLIFWLNFCISLLLAIGRRDLTMRSTQYEPIDGSGGMTMDDYEAHYLRVQQEQQQQRQQQQQQQPTATGYAGNYASVPEIRSHADEDDYSINSESSSVARSEKSNRIVTSV